jgi:hypothetical protein
MKVRGVPLTPALFSKVGLEEAKFGAGRGRCALDHFQSKSEPQSIPPLPVEDMDG